MAGEWSHLSQLYNFEVNLMQIHKSIPTDAWPIKLCHFLVFGRSNFTVEFQSPTPGTRQRLDRIFEG